MICCSRAVKDRCRAQNLFDLTLAIQALLVPLEGLLHRLEEFLIPDRLGQELDCACLHGSNRHRHIAVACDEDYRRADVFRGKSSLEFEAPQPGKPHIEHDAAGSARAFACQEFASGGK